MCVGLFYVYFVFVYPDVTVPVTPTLLVEKPGGVHYLVDYGSVLETPIL